VFGSIWPEDIEFFGPSAASIPGTLFVFPHEITPGMKDKLIEAMIQVRMDLGRVVVVETMGLLAEFYREAEWAVVGGGFGKGVHSVLEPAVAGCWVACGPAGTERSSDVRTLPDLVEILRTPAERDRYFLKLKLALASGLLTKQQRAAALSGHFGGTDQVARSVVNCRGESR
jgi:hypothetical protein